MAGTFSQIYVQAVFAVNGRWSLLKRPWREEVFKFREEYLEFLEKFEVPFNERYLFEWLE